MRSFPSLTRTVCGCHISYPSVVTQILLHFLFLPLHHHNSQILPLCPPDYAIWSQCTIMKSKFCIYSSLLWPNEYRTFLWNILYAGWARITESIQQPTTGWTVRGLKSGGGWDLPHQPRPALGPTQPPVQQVWGLFPGNEVTRSIPLSLYGHSWPVLEWILPLPYRKLALRPGMYLICIKM